MTEEEIKQKIGRFLGGAAVADHLGDIRDDETHLWEALGVEPAELRDARYETDGEPIPTIKELVARHNELAQYFPDYILQDDEDEEDEA